jgi:putative spermidine/putrescine transport system permease protein
MTSTGQGDRLASPSWYRGAMPGLLPVLVLLVLGYLVPMGTILWTSLHRGPDVGLAAYAEVLGSATILRIVVRTLEVAVGTTLLCLMLGYPFAYFVATRGRRWAGLLLALIAVPYLSSVLIRSYAWIAILGGNGLVNRALLELGLVNEPLALVFNSTGSMIGMVHILLPMIVLPIYAAMQRIDPVVLAAARNLGAHPASVFFTVFLPLSAPGVVAGCALVFLSALGFYITPALLGSPGDYLIAQAIEVRVSMLAEFDVAAAQACLLLLLVGGALFLLRDRLTGAAEGAPGRRAASASGDGLRKSTFGIRLPRLAWPGRVAERVARLAGPMLWVLTGLLLVFLLAPMLVVSMVAFSNAPYLTFPPPGYSTRWFVAFLEDSRWLEAALFSVVVSILAAFGALVVASPLAFALARRNFRGRQLLWLLAISPMIVPHIIIGLGLFFTFVALHLNGNPTTFWIAYMVTGVPYVVIIMLSALRRFDVRLEQAAASLGGHPLVVFRTVTLPVLWLPFLSSFLFAFLTAFDDLIISLFLSSPRGTTLAMRMWEDIRLEISPKTAVVGVLQLGVLVVVMICAALVKRRSGRTRSLR